MSCARPPRRRMEEVGEFRDPLAPGDPADRIEVDNPDDAEQIPARRPEGDPESLIAVDNPDDMDLYDPEEAFWTPGLSRSDDL